MRECQRCLKPGDNLSFSVPFLANAQETLTRARVTETGELEHLLPAEYHGDPSPRTAASGSIISAGT